MKSSKASDDTLFREYSEAGSLCRSYEQLTRTSVSIYVPFATAVFIYMIRDASVPNLNVAISGLALVVSALTWTTLYRVREFYHLAKTRALKIESRLGMGLFHALDDRSREMKRTPSNKVAALWIVATCTVIFGGVFFVNLVVWIVEV